MKILITGIDGYIGWSLAQHLAQKGHHLSGIDQQIRRKAVAEVGSHSATPIASIEQRLQAFSTAYQQPIDYHHADLTDYDSLLTILRQLQPDTIVHLAEIPSAPYSMIDAKHAALTQHNNVIGTLNLLYAMLEACPTAHLVKLGTMGEYGTPNIDIPEGTIEIAHNGRKDSFPFPKQAGSWYHWSKVHDSNNIMFACRTWGLRSTDIMQGVVFGVQHTPTIANAALCTRFDFDQCFGTIINRFCAQAIIEHPLTIFGSGQQKRSFIPLKDAMQCLTLVIDNPPETGEYRVLNQFQQVYALKQLAQYVQQAAQSLGLASKIGYLENPRSEMSQHYFNPCHDKLLALGYQPSHDIEEQLYTMLQQLQPYRDRIWERRQTIIPDIVWQGKNHKMSFQHFETESLTANTYSRTEKCT